MKIAVITSRPVPRDAVSNFVMDSAQALKSLGDVTVYTFGYDREPVPGVELRYMGIEGSHSIKSNLNAILHRAGLARELSAYDVLILDNPDIGSIPAVAGAKKLNSGLKVYWTFHGLTPSEHLTLRKDRVLTAIRWPIFIKSMKASDGVQVFSPSIRRELVQRGVPPEKIEVIPFGVDTQRFASGDGDRVRKKYEVASLQGFIVLYVGRLVLHKHVEEIIRAINLVPGTTLLIVGTGPERDNLDFLSTRVVFAGSVPDEELADYYAAADVLALASRHEGFCVPVVEAMAAGKPVIAPNISAMPDTAGAAALLYPSGSVICLARCIEKMKNKPEYRQQKACIARDLSRMYDRESTMRRYVDYIGGRQ